MNNKQNDETFIEKPFKVIYEMPQIKKCSDCKFYNEFTRVVNLFNHREEEYFNIIKDIDNVFNDVALLVNPEGLSDKTYEEVPKMVREKIAYLEERTQKM